MKLFKAISTSGILSRRKSMSAVKEAMVTVNGELILDPSYEVKSNDDIRLDNQKINLNIQLTTILLNKPRGYLSTKSDENNRKTIFDLVPNKPALNHIGRLDMDTTGAILLTNDGNLAQFLMHPKNKIEKEYLAISNEFFDEKTINKLRKGIFIGSGQKGKAKIDSQEKNKGKVEIRLILKQGKKNEIRRIFKFLDLNLYSLKRLRVGEIKLGSLPIGSWRPLSKKELKYLSVLQSK